MKSNLILMMGAKKKAVNGYLYNWYAVSDANFAPTDWKVPTKTEFETLSTYLGGDTVSGGKLKATGTTYWNTPNTGADNTSGFTYLGSGNRGSDGNFYALKTIGSLWTITDFDATNKYFVRAYNNDATFPNSAATTRDIGYPVRLLYTGAGTPSTVTDYDGNVYDTVTIGTQIFTKQNWKCSRLANGSSIPLVTDGTTWIGLTTLARCSYNNDDTLI